MSIEEIKEEIIYVKSEIRDYENDLSNLWGIGQEYANDELTAALTNYRNDLTELQEALDEAIQDNIEQLANDYY